MALTDTPGDPNSQWIDQDAAGPEPIGNIGHKDGQVSPFAFGNGSIGYGGNNNEALYHQEQNQWRQLGARGVTPTQVDSSLSQNVDQAAANQAQARSEQYQSLGLMGAYASGAKTPAQQQAENTLAYNQAAQNAMAANAGGPQALAAARARAANSAATAQSNNANAMRSLKAQEQENYANQYLNQANDIRKGENQMYETLGNANYQAATNQADINKANDSLMLGYGGLQNAAINAQQNINIGQGNFALQQNAQNWSNQMQVASMALNTGSAFAKGLGSSDWGGDSNNNSNSGNNYNPSGNGDNYQASTGSFQDDVNNSDVRKKTGIRGSGLMGSFLDTLARSRATYRYKNPADEPRSTPTGGRYAGVMAQDLERVPELGHQLVIDTPHGKYVDNKTMLSALSAGVGEIHERVRRLEGRK